MASNAFSRISNAQVNLAEQFKEMNEIAFNWLVDTKKQYNVKDYGFVLRSLLTTNLKQTKTLLSKDNKVFLASQERFELPLRPFPYYFIYFDRSLNISSPSRMPADPFLTFLRQSNSG